MRSKNISCSKKTKKFYLYAEKKHLDNNKKIDFVGAWHLCEDTNANYYLDA